MASVDQDIWFVENISYTPTALSMILNDSDFDIQKKLTLTTWSTGNASELDYNNSAKFANDSIDLHSYPPNGFRTTVVPPGCIVHNQEFAFLPWDNPDSVVSLETTYLIWEIMSSSILPLLTVTGFFANILNVVVFAKQGLKERINFLLFCVSIADFLVVAYNLLVTMDLLSSVVRGKFQMFGVVVTFVTNYNISWLYSCFYVSAFITTLVAVDRCLCITFPFTAKRILKTKTTMIVVAATTVILVACHYVIADKYRIHCLYYTALGIGLRTYHPSPFYLSHTLLVDVLNGVVYGVVLPIFFVLTTSIATIVTAVKLRTAAAFRKDQGGQDKKEIAVTKMLISVSCLFIACTIPNVLFRIVPLILPEYTLGGRNQNMLTTFIAIIHVTSVVNSSLNFFFYVKMGTKFRATLCELCCCCWCCGCCEKRCERLKKKADGIGASSSDSGPRSNSIFVVSQRKK